MPALAILAGLAIARLPLTAAAGLLGAVTAAVLTVIFPLFGLGLALLLGPLGALEELVFGGALLDSGQIVLLLALAAWVGSGLARRRLSIPATSLNAPWLLFVSVAALTLLDARSVPLGLIELVKWLEIGLIIWLMVDLSTDDTRHPSGPAAMLHFVLAFLLLAGLGQAVLGIWQFGLRGDGPEHFLVLGRFYRAYGTFEQPNPFGGYMNLIALPAAGTALGRLAARQGWRGRGCGRANTFWLVFVLICAAAATLGVIFSWSRGAWLGFMAGAAVLLLFSTRHWLAGLGVGAVATVIIGGGLLWGISAGFGPALSIADRVGGFREELSLGDVRGVDINDENYAVIERLAHWQAAIGMAEDDLWSGVGFGNYEVAYADYDLINWPDALGHAHNYYLNLLAETGLPGLLAYLIFWMAMGLQAIRLIARLAWPERGVAVGLLAAFAALAVHHLVDKLYVNNIYIHLGAMLGLLQMLAWPGFRAREEPNSHDVPVPADDC